MAKKQTKFQKNKEEIKYNLINSAIPAGLVILGALSGGNLTFESIITALVAGGIVALTKFQKYWGSQEKKYTKLLFNFY